MRKILIWSRHGVKNILFCVMPALLLSITTSAGAQFVGVSETSVWLSDERPSAEVMLLTSDVPLEYKIEANFEESNLPNTSVVKWAPRQILIPASTSSPLRFRLRSGSDLPPGDYGFNVKISAKPVTFTPPFSKEHATQDMQARGNQTQGRVSIEPSLTISVFVRNSVVNPDLDVSFLEMPSSVDVSPSFIVRKQKSATSFLGFMEFVNKDTGVSYGRRKLRLNKLSGEKKISYPSDVNSQHNMCLQVWASWDPASLPDHVACSG